MPCQYPYSFGYAGSFLRLTLLLAVSGTLAEEECEKGIEVPPGNYSDWPEMFRLTDPYPEDPTVSNKDESAGTVDPTMMLSAGVIYKYMDPTGYDYPNKTEIPWSPPEDGNNDMALQQFRDEHDYQYADIIALTEFKQKFYEEHLHEGGDEVRYVIDGSGYFDVRDVNDQWVRIHAKTGDFFILPMGIKHRFALDDKSYIQAMRLYPGSGEPEWSSTPRSEVKGNSTARNEYVEKYLCGIDPDLGAHGHDGHDHDIVAQENSLRSTSGSEVGSLFSSSSLIVFAASFLGIVLF